MISAPKAKESKSVAALLTQHPAETHSRGSSRVFNLHSDLTKGTPLEPRGNQGFFTVPSVCFWIWRREWCVLAAKLIFNISSGFPLACRSECPQANASAMKAFQRFDEAILSRVIFTHATWLTTNVVVMRAGSEAAAWPNLSVSVQSGLVPADKVMQWHHCPPGAQRWHHSNST